MYVHLPLTKIILNDMVQIHCCVLSMKQVNYQVLITASTSIGDSYDREKDWRPWREDQVPGRWWQVETTEVLVQQYYRDDIILLIGKQFLCRQKPFCLLTIATAAVARMPDACRHLTLPSALDACCHQVSTRFAAAVNAFLADYLMLTPIVICMHPLLATSTPIGCQLTIPSVLLTQFT